MEKSVEQAASATAQVIDRLMSHQLREGRGFERESVLQLQQFAVEAVNQLSAIVVELAEQLDRQRVATTLASPVTDSAASTDPLVRTILELSEPDRQRAYDYVQLMLMSTVRRRLSSS
jgi:hypothetical protein